MTNIRLLFLMVSFLGGCGGASTIAAEPVDLAGNWKSDDKDYRDVTAAWTRIGRIHSALPRRGQVLEVAATLKSPPWRTAYADFLAERALFGPERRQALLDRMKKEESEYYEVELLVTVDDRRANDLHKGARSAWRVALVDDSGVEIEAKTVTRDRRPRSVLRAEYPHLTHFHECYVAKFPKATPLFRADARRVALKVGGQKGGVELVWEARRPL